MPLQSTKHQCDLLGLGSIGTVPFNFPGAGSSEVVAARPLNSGIVESLLVPGANADVPAVWGGDLGAPYVHDDKLYMSFGDAWFQGVIRTSPLPSVEGQPPQPGAPLNDDVLASVELSQLSASAACIPLDIPRLPETGQVSPITWNGPANQGGAPLGGGAVPGPGFSTGKHMFMLVTRADSPTCGETEGDCSAANGLATDTCIADVNGVARCYFGECELADPRSPCALRLNPSQLVVRRAGTDFVEPQVGEHVVASHVSHAYRGHFSTVSFFSQVDVETGDGSVWVLGRETFWGAPGLVVSPYLMVHPVRDGVLGLPKFFAGMHGDTPRWSHDGDDAQPLYDETKMLSNHTSLMFEPALSGGTWLMLYGGHSQPVLRSLIGLFVSPVDDALFYDRDTGIYLRTAKEPWGPWSEPQTIFNPYQRGQGGYCESMYFEDPAGVTNFMCPPETVEHNAALNRVPGVGMGGEYGAALVPGLSLVGAGNFTLRWLLSTWNPYRVIVLESVLETTEEPPLGP